jgi:hypothetical protein
MRAVLDALRVDGDWMSGKHVGEYFVGATTLPTAVGVPVVPALFALGTWYAWRTARQTAALFAIIGVALIAAVLSLSRLEAPQYLYLWLWLPALAMFVWIALAALALDVASDPSSARQTRRVSLAALTGLGVVVAYVSLHLAREEAGDLVVLVAMGAAFAALVAIVALRPSRLGTAGIALVCAGAFAICVVAVVPARAGHVRDLQPTASVASRKDVDAVGRIADRVPEGAIDLRWDPHATSLQETPQLLADALAQRGHDVTLPRASREMFGPELTSATDGRRAAVWLADASHPPPARGVPLGSTGGVAAYLVVPTRARS